MKLRNKNYLSIFTKLIINNYVTRIDGDVQKRKKKEEKDMNKTIMCPTDSTCKWHSEESPYHALALPFPYTYLKDLSLINHTKRLLKILEICGGIYVCALIPY